MGMYHNGLVPKLSAIPVNRRQTLYTCLITNQSLCGRFSLQRMHVSIPSMFLFEWYQTSKNLIRDIVVNNNNNNKTKCVVRRSSDYEYGRWRKVSDELDNGHQVGKVSTLTEWRTIDRNRWTAAARKRKLAARDFFFRFHFSAQTFWMRKHYQHIFKTWVNLLTYVYNLTFWYMALIFCGSWVIASSQIS